MIADGSIKKDKQLEPLKVQVVEPLTALEVWGRVLGSLFRVGYTALIIWWFFATWMPELGLTWWGLILPVYAFRVLTARAPWRGKTEVTDG